MEKFQYNSFPVAAPHFLLGQVLETPGVPFIKCFIESKSVRMGHSLSSHQAASLTFLFSRMTVVCFFALCCKGKKVLKRVVNHAGLWEHRASWGAGWSFGDKGGVQVIKQVRTGGPSPEQSRRLYLGQAFPKPQLCWGLTQQRWYLPYLGLQFPWVKRDISGNFLFCVV